MRNATAGAAGFLGALIWISPAAAVQPARLDGAIASTVESAQFRFPWETRAKPKRPQKRSTRRERPRQKPAARRNAPKAPAAAGAGAAAGAASAARADPLDAPLPPSNAPLGVATPRGATEREARGWRDAAAQIPLPAPAPTLAPDGPAPRPTAVVASFTELERLRQREFARSDAESASRPRPTAAARNDDEEDETVDLHVPLPPVRPQRPGDAPPRRDGLSPDGRGLAPEGRGLAPENGLSAEAVPLPPKRPDGEVAALEPDDAPKPPPVPSAPDIELPVVAHDDDPACRALAADGIVEAQRIPPIEGPGVCGGGPLVSLTGIRRKDGELIKLNTAATLRCGMARELAAYLRDDVAPAADTAGAELVRLDIAGSFQCRGRNGAAGGKMSEHGRANAVDLMGFGFRDGRTLGVFAPDLPQGMPATLKATACGRFSTVLGPGSDGFHETHLHLDLQPRRSKAKLCQWSDPEVARASEAGKSDAEGAKDPRDADQKEPWPRRKAAKPEAPEPPKDKTP